ncbi:MAG: hypothetical protein WBV71_07460 [Roseobacter sp.]
MIGPSNGLLITIKSGSTKLSRPEITLNSRAGFPDNGTAYPKGLIWMQNGISINWSVFCLGDVG